MSKTINNLLSADFEELSLRECGREKCQPGKVIDIDVKEYHLFHYILYGSGTFIMNSKTYDLHKGNIFYIPPGKTAHYFPDKKNPWIYTWVGFSGSRADEFIEHLGLSESDSVFYDKDLILKPLFNDLADKYNHSKFLNLDCMAIFIQVMQKMILKDHKQEVELNARQTHIRIAKQFIENNYQFNIKVKDIADSLSLSPNYLANVFKVELGISPKQYLIDYRIQKACQFLSNGDVLIKDVAKQTGYLNPLHFSSEFKRIKHMSPKEYRNKNIL